MGDPSGIGPEVILKALATPGLSKLADFTVIGDRRVLEGHQAWGLRTDDFTIIDLRNVARKGFAFGKVRPEYGKAAIEYLRRGLELIKSRGMDCLVTAPLNKKAVNLAGYHFSGQTEYIARTFRVKDAVMMLFNEKLRVVLATRHIPLKDVAKGISAEKIFKVILTTALGLKSLFGIKKPKLSVCGLNPHASDSGVMGGEEGKFIIPAIAMARRKGINAEGPYPADTIFQKAIAGKYDCVVCMYHDQGLIPLKLSGFQEAVNITLGLPFLRTSPGHGTAFDIAGRNQADPASLIRAIQAAVLCTQNLKKA
jgi:4-hydroxythreonine-4-phosphate dehydrogenase